MVAKILSTFNSNFLTIATLFIFGGQFSFCSSKIAWIRELPDASVQVIKSDVLPLGIYKRPVVSRAAMGAKSHEFVIYEWIHLLPDQKFRKEYRLSESLKDQNRFEIRIGTGTYSQLGPWILFVTNQKETKDCGANVDLKQISNFKSDPCPNTKPTKSDSNHRLLYHYESLERSIAHLQYESGYIESNFGIGWEVITPYKENEMFKGIRAKFVKKEFQPHVYYYERLD
jgi:hypothetical protein